MARPPRIEFEGAVYHVTARGNERRLIYRSDEDCRLFLETLEQMRARFGILVHCFCLMPNHFHLVIETPQGNLSRAMAWLQTTYTIRFNRKYRRSGHLFQGRYKAHLVEADAYGMELLRYIHLNPVRPRKKSDPVPVERMKTLEAYEWSSHRDYTGKRRDCPVKTSSEWLCFWHREKRTARRRYRKFINAAFDHEIDPPWASLKGGLVLGSEQLCEKTREIISGKKSAEYLRWTSRAAIDAARRRIAKQIAEEQDERMKIWMRVELGGEKMAAIARELGYRDGSGVHRVVQRMNASAKENPKLQARLRKLREETIPL